MNIFYLDKSPYIAAKYHCDKHVVKMIVEAAQMLCTAHRILDGKQVVDRTGLRKRTHWVHPVTELDAVLYQATHYNHPSSVWTRASLANYKWHYELFMALCTEYTHRYRRIHSTEKLLQIPLYQTPEHIPDIGPTVIPLAMQSQPQCMHRTDPVRSYREFYKTKQTAFTMKWSHRDVPPWFSEQS
jgi:hypothetical protein